MTARRVLSVASEFLKLVCIFAIFALVGVYLGVPL